MACAQRAAGLQLSCCAPGSSPAQLTAVQVGRASARPTTNPAQGAPPPYPCRPAPHAPRRARAHPPCPSHRTIGRFAPLSHNSHTRVPTFVQGSTRAFERCAVRLLGMRFLSKNALYRQKNSSGAPPRAPGQDRTLGRVQGVLGGAAVQMYGRVRLLLFCLKLMRRVSNAHTAFPPLGTKSSAF